MPGEFDIIRQYFSRDRAEDGHKYVNAVLDKAAPAFRPAEAG